MIGVVGMSLTDFDTLIWPQVEAISTAYHAREERESQRSWEQTRMIMWQVIRPHLKKGAKLYPKDVLPFSWDASAAPALQDEASAQQTAKELDDFWERLDKKKNRDVEQSG